MKAKVHYTESMNVELCRIFFDLFFFYEKLFLVGIHGTQKTEEF